MWVIYMLLKIRDLVIDILYYMLHIFWLFKIRKDRIFFDSYDGRQFSDSPKYIFEALDPSFGEKIWFVRNKNVENIRDAITVQKKGIRYLYYIMTSRIVITNMNLSAYIPFRKKQVLINTWHGGGAYKYSVYNEDLDRIHRSYEKFNIFLSSSKVSTKYVIRETFGFDKKIIECGLPRNDIFFNKNTTIKNKVYDYYGIDEDVVLVLYAPTYRDYSSSNIEQLDFANVKCSVEKAFGKNCVILNRSHHLANCVLSRDSFLDATNYSDMQELLITADILITDYSSSIWDFSITMKPCFLYTPDLDEFDKKRSFYIDINEWGVPVSKNNKELCKCIENFELESFENAIKKMHSEWGSFESGNATNTVVNLLREIVDNG